jgi:hypothetical protein
LGSSFDFLHFFRLPLPYLQGKLYFWVDPCGAVTRPVCEMWAGSDLRHLQASCSGAGDEFAQVMVIR